MTSTAAQARKVANTIAIDLAATLTQDMVWITKETPPVGCTEGLTAHIEAWLGNKFMPVLNEEPEGPAFEAYLGKLFAAAERNLQ